MTAADRARSAPLDGVRALAVVAVLAYHAHYPWAVGGYLGVDVFFVLSGYLITQVLLRTRRSWAGYRDFLLRRAVRLLPALLAATAGVAVLVLATGTGHERDVLLPCSAASVGYVMNLPVAEHLSCPAMWHVTWSLAAEQQFYLLWPLLLGALVAVPRSPGVRVLARRAGLAVRAEARRWRVLGVAGAAALGLWALSVAWQALLLHHGASTSRVAYAPDGRSMVLLLGCGLALVTAVRRAAAARFADRWADATAAAAVATLGLCVVLGDLGSGVDALVPLLSAGLAALGLVWAAAHAPAGSLLARTLGAWPVAWLGRVSYSLYLWHEVAYRLAESVAPRGSLPAELLRFAFALGLAAASYAWVELPAQRWWGGRVSGGSGGAGAAPTARTHTPHPRPSRLPRRAVPPSTPVAHR